MKTVQDILDANPLGKTPPTFSTPAKPSLPAKWIASLFAKLQARYGLQFSQQWTTDELRQLAMREWAERLGPLSGEQIKHGLDIWDSHWPPNVEQFKAACLGTHENWENRGAAYKRFAKALPKPKGDPQVAADALQAMRQMIRTRT